MTGQSQDLLPVSSIPRLGFYEIAEQVANFTYIGVAGGWLYQVDVIYLFSRRVV